MYYSLITYKDGTKSILEHYTFIEAINLLNKIKVDDKLSLSILEDNKIIAELRTIK